MGVQARLRRGDAQEWPRRSGVPGRLSPRLRWDGSLGSAAWLGAGGERVGRGRIAGQFGDDTHGQTAASDEWGCRPVGQSRVVACYQPLAGESFGGEARPAGAVGCGQVAPGSFGLPGWRVVSPCVSCATHVARGFTPVGPKPFAETAGTDSQHQASGTSSCFDSKGAQIEPIGRRTNLAAADPGRSVDPGEPAGTPISSDPEAHGGSLGVHTTFP